VGAGLRVTGAAVSGWWAWPVSGTGTRSWRGTGGAAPGSGSAVTHQRRRRRRHAAPPPPNPWRSSSTRPAQLPPSTGSPCPQWVTPGCGSGRSRILLGEPDSRNAHSLNPVPPFQLWNRIYITSFTFIVHWNDPLLKIRSCCQMVILILLTVVHKF